jgi:hypothetical protein
MAYKKIIYALAYRKRIYASPYKPATYKQGSSEAQTPGGFWKSDLHLFLQSQVRPREAIAERRFLPKTRRQRGQAANAEVDAVPPLYKTRFLPASCTSITLAQHPRSARYRSAPGKKVPHFRSFCHFNCPGSCS